MNERIRELAEKAGFSLVDIRNAFDYNEDNPYQEFTKLIAQECANFVEQDQGTGADLADRLRKYFSVE